ncbi:MAG TPA: pyridoxamine 5'-phosphate oxidase family protein [Bacteroidales bacterium]|nr:pyridoxamine 5'-phosphate oxidase family protein [Bacteroidales bacterium]HOX78866.1 pyridoxamine 5'-phosphate oxidase family protein [Bacteroidales bacterium]HPM92967.1 pyridoxamine 5'-phosphate oxidase family protein [Bacteroidales bacterium]
MTIQDCIKFTNENPICYLATVENDQPRVRIIHFWFADESGFYFQTGSIKEMYRQLKANPKMEACFYRHEGMLGTMLRIAGEAEFLNDKQMKEKAMADRPFLKEFGLSADSPHLIIFRIAHGQAYFWTKERNLLPKEYIEF